MDKTYSAGHDIVVLPYHEPAGAFGFLPVNAYLIKASEPILVDTGIMTQAGPFIETLRGELDLRELRWIFLTHEDLDHSGAIVPLLEAAPNARLVLSFTAMLKGGAGDAAANMGRLVIATPGKTVTAGGRRFAVIRPPVFDSSATVAYFDEKTRTLFSADAFGGLVPQPATTIEEVGDAYIPGSATFTLANSVWLHDVDPARLKRNIDVVRTAAPELVLSSHAVPLQGRSEEVCDALAAMPTMAPVEMPDNEMFQAILAQMKSAEQRPAA
jgi:flavorubredoxin